MSKIIKKYNEATHTWENISNLENKLIQVTDENVEVTDNRVIVTNANYGTDSTLNEALTTISEDISKLQRNVSWLAEHGGGGGGNYDGPSGGDLFSIEIGTVYNGKELANVSENAFYFNDDIVTIEFRVINGNKDDLYGYSYTIDGNLVKPNKTIQPNVYESIVLKNLDKNTTHTLSIRVNNEFNEEAKPVNLTIRPKTFSISLRSGEGINSVENGILYLQNGTNGDTEFVIENSLNGSVNTVVFSYGTSEMTYTSVTKSKKEIVTVPLLSIAGILGINNIYTFSASLKVYDSNTKETIDGGKIDVNALVVPNNDMYIKLSNIVYESSYNAESPNPEILSENELNSTISFGINVSVPTSFGSNEGFYAIKIEKYDGTNQKLIKGLYFDETLKETNSYLDNLKFSNRNDQIINYTLLPTDGFNPDDIVRVTVKSWVLNNNTKRYVDATISGLFIVKPENSELFEYQIPNRNSANKRSTLLARWNSNSIPSSKSDKWDGQVNTYKPIDINYELSESYLTLYNTNGISNGFTNDVNGNNAVCLTNGAYSVIDLNNIKEELSNSCNNGKGFNLSFTFMTKYHPFNDRTVLTMGNCNVSNDGMLNDGRNSIRIDLEEVKWVLPDGSYITSKLRQNVLNTVDFSYYSDNNSVRTYKIFVNGIMSAIKTSQYSTTEEPISNIFDNGISLASETDGSRNSNVYFYDISLFTSNLLDYQIVVNSKNNKIFKLTDEVTADYKEWKNKNYLYSYEAEPKVPYCYFYDNDKLIDGVVDINDFITKIVKVTKLPIVVIELDPNQTLTYDSFLQSYGSKEDAVGVTASNGTLTFYAEGGSKIVDFRVSVELQGTSTLIYRIKNFEIKLIDKIKYPDADTEGLDLPQLFQPIKTWLPENEFTLKADIVDSSHANNATIGEWVNNLPEDIMEKNPAMLAFDDVNNKPKDKINGQLLTHKNEFNASEDIDYDENVTIKHTLEGFPIMLIVKFSGNDTMYRILGNYSFNLGRYSYYNMGLKFLESYSRRNIDDSGKPTSDPGCPAVINTYKEYEEQFSSIDLNNVCSYEFTSACDTYRHDGMSCVDTDEGIITYIGDIKYSGGTSTNTHIRNLSYFFDRTGSVRLRSNSRYDTIKKYKYDSTTKSAYETNESIVAEEILFGDMNKYFSLKNGNTYFEVANAFGMKDSLGKNLTIRTWDGVKWYPCFYDMDTALGLDNVGKEDEETDSFIDKYTERQIGSVEVEKNKQNNESSPFGCISNKLWDICRDTTVVSASTNNDILGQEIWHKLRSDKNLLGDSESFINYMIERIGNNGEMLYNYDYNIKYVGDTKSESFLHGLRIEFVRSWLKKRLNFLDYPFYTTKLPSGFYDSPFNNESIDIATNGFTGKEVDGAYAPLTITSTSSCFTKITIGSDNTYYHFLRENVPTKIYLNTGAESGGKQTTITSSSLIKVLDGLDNFYISEITKQGKEGLSSLISFSPIDSTSIKTAFDFEKLFISEKYGYSSLESVNLTNTKCSTNYSVIISNDSAYYNLKDVNISNSNVQTLTLGNTPLRTLVVNNSKIVSLNLRDQTILKAINVDGCNNLATIKVVNCQKIKTFEVKNLPNVTIVYIEKCDELNNLSIIGNNKLETVTIKDSNILSEVVISGNTALNELELDSLDGLKNLTIVNNIGLSKISLTNCKNLENLIIDTNKNENLKIEINGENLVSLKNIVLRSLVTTNPIDLTDLNDLSNLTSITINDFSSFNGFSFNGEQELIDGNFVLDFSNSMSLIEKNMNFHTEDKVVSKSYTLDNVHYIRFNNNIENGGFEITRKLFNELPNIERVFGFIVISDNSIFSNKQLFKLNDDYIYTENGAYDYDQNLAFNNSETFTNIVINSKNLSRSFSGTKCDIDDVYYVFSKINEDVVDVSYMFSECKNIKGREDVTPMDEYGDDLFGDGLTGPENLSDEIFDNNIYYGKYLVLDERIFDKCKNVSNIEGLFSNCYFALLIHSGLKGGFSTIFNKFTNDGETSNISEFKNVFLNDLLFTDQTLSFLTNTNISKNLVSLTGLKVKCFGDDYYSDNYYDKTMLKNFNKLERIEESFNDIYLNLCTDDNNTTEEREIELFDECGSLISIVNSFNNIHVGDGTNNEIGLYHGLFNGCPNLYEIIGSFTFNTETQAKIYFSNNFFENNTKLSKIVIDDRGYYLPFSGALKILVGDEDNEFPDRMFEKCVSLTNIPNLLEGAVLLNAVDNPDYESTIKVPGKLFNTTRKITNLSHFFDGMLNGTKCSIELTKNGFANCDKLEDVSYIFANCNIAKQIPYRLFYNDKRTIKDISYAFFGISNYSGRIPQYTALDEDIKNELYVSGTSYEYVFNGKKVYSETIITEDGYELNRTNTMKWNLLLFDGSYDFVERIKPYIKTIDGYPLTVPFEWEIEVVGNTDNLTDFEAMTKGLLSSDKYFEYRDIFYGHKYVCPPDIFAYCMNSTDLNINGVFMSTGNYTNNGEIKGLNGVIPYNILYSIEHVKSVNSLFSGLSTIFPDKLPNREIVDGLPLMTRGKQYPEKMFEMCTSLNNINGLFGFNNILGYCEIPSKLFDNVKDKIYTAAGLFDHSNFIEDANVNQQTINEYVGQMPNDLFSGFASLTIVSNMFNRSNAFIKSELFNDSRNTISNCSGFMNYSKSVGLSLPDFWNFKASKLLYMEYEDCYSGIEYPGNFNNYDTAKNNGYTE